MLWLNRPRASRDISLQVVNDDGVTVAVVLVRTSSEEVNIELQRIEDDPRIVFVVP